MVYPYSDGSPLHEIAAVLVLLAIAALLSRFGLGGYLEKAAGGLARGLRRSGLFSDQTGLSAEVHRLDLLRVVIGCLALWHYGSEFSAAMAAGSVSNSMWFGITAALSLFMAIGFLTPLSSVALLLLINIIVVNYTLNISIGSLAIAMCTIPMALSPAGYTVSVDAMLFKRSRIIRAIYAAWGAPTVDRIQLARFMALAAFWSINIYSAAKHLSSQTWLDGLTTGTILLFPMINPKYYQWADALYYQSPFLYVMLSKFTTYGMLVWQFALVPLVLASRFTRIIAICWGMIFFVFSAHVLAIKTLGIYEYVLFAIVFWSRSWIDDPGRHSLMIFFDDKCNLCDRTVRTLARIDLFHRLEFRPLSQNVALAKSYGVSQQEALTDLVGISPAGQRYDGYRLYQRISAIVLLAVPFWPLLALGRVLLIGPALYRFIADRRTRLFGVCQLGSHRARVAWEPPQGSNSHIIFTAFGVCFLVLFGAYAVRLPIVETAFPGPAAAATSYFGRAPLAFGMGHIDVFNEHDLRLYRKLTTTFFLDEKNQVTQYRMPYSEWLGGRLTEDLRAIKEGTLYCSTQWGKTIASAVVSTTSDQDPVRGWKVQSTFQAADHPSHDDFLSYRYAPMEMKTTCVTYTPVSNPELTQVDYPQPKFTERASR
ncbi:DCC1-like thiol-disulfide oxidoreductase family protein [Bosea sp. BK604]|uniref:DCC1-like thiol-disulfide oxidoreductase family protein n=1 Tax=Bosea sp. BK604 TaxID=2512180 RepID=UPI0010D8554D|nr:DCC1-like thiol-disulfide oxidoreductase family protein [Bosea sp. BK604]TCR64693.1 putative DCC family thiol-disulfide oxidoreductase YuxK [Bosea sp. BK604]